MKKRLGLMGFAIVGFTIFSQAENITVTCITEKKEAKIKICNNTNGKSNLNNKFETDKDKVRKIKVLIPIPSYGFDPTEVAIPWKQMLEKNIEVFFATPDGEKARPDSIMLSGKKLGLGKFVLPARKDAVSACVNLENNQSFCNPLKYTEVQESDFDAIFLPGGHDKGVKEYLESKVLQNLIVDFFKAIKPVGAICHGVVLVSRSIDPETKKSVIYNYKTTSLLKSQEMSAYKLTKRKLNDYYLTYPGLTVEDEVKSYLSDSNNYLKGPIHIFRNNGKHLKEGFVVKDRNYLSARWGDVYSFSEEFIKMVQDHKSQ